MDEIKDFWRRIHSEIRIKPAKNFASAASAPSFKSYVDLSHLERDEASSRGRIEKDMLRRSFDNAGTCRNTTLSDKDVDYYSKSSTDGKVKSLERNSNLLCGFLYQMKLGSKSLGKTFKRRWFVMADDTCTLLYYSTPRDQIPLGQIEIYRAVIIFDLELDLNIFEVRTPEKSILLKADDNHTMMYWIQNLQKKRKKFFLLKDLSLESEEEEKYLVNSSEFQSILKKVERPIKTVGESTAILPDLSRNKSFRDISLSKLRADFQNKFSKFKSSNIGGAIKNDFQQEPSQNIAKTFKSSEHFSDSEANQDLSSQGGRGTRLFDTLKGKFSRSFESQSCSSSNQNQKRSLFTILKGNSSENCSDCFKLQNIIDELNIYKDIQSDELKATQIRCRNLLKSSAKLSKEFNNWKNLLTLQKSNKTGEDFFSEHEDCLKDLKSSGDRIVDLEDFILTMQSELEIKNDLVKSLKSRLDLVDDEVQNLKDNLKLKDEMLNFLSDKCTQLSGASCEKQSIPGFDHISSKSNISSCGNEPYKEVIEDKDSLLQRDAAEKCCGDHSFRKSDANIDDCEETPPLNFNEFVNAELGTQIGDFWDTKSNLQFSQLDVITCDIFESKNTNAAEIAVINDVTDQSSVSEEHFGIAIDNTDFGGAHASNNVRTSSLSEAKSGSESEPWIICAGDKTLNEMKSLEKKEDEQVAYKIQNQMLNQEILDLNEMLLLNENRLDQSQIKYFNKNFSRITQLEAMCYQLQGKYLKSLKEILLLCSDDDSRDSLRKIKNLIEADLSKDASNNENLNRNILENTKQAYDQYGFEKHASHQQVNASFSDIQRRSNPLKSRADLTLSLKWDTMLISLERGTSKKSPELKLMVREGVPNQFRVRLWKICIDFILQDYRNNSVVKSYSSLLDMISSKIVVTPAANQIELDLLRTLPNNKHFTTLSSLKIISLRNILLAFSIHNPEVGYCQGLNRLAAILLLFLNEEESFWGLVAIVEVIMPPKYYSHTLIAAHADQRVLKEFVSEKLPVLVNHFTALSFDLSLFTFSWFLTVFVDNMPVNSFLRIWDTFLYEGSKVLFRYSVAILKYYEEQILCYHTAAEMNMFVRNMCEGLHDIDRLSQIAFNELNPFSMKKVKSKRNIHLVKLTQELQELDKLRHSFENSFTLHQKSHNNLELKRSNASNVSSDDND